MTKPYETEDLEKKLASGAPEPPAELLSALKKEIPRDLAAAARPASARRGPRRWRLVAATLAIGVVGLVVSLRVRQEVSPVPAETARVPPAFAPVESTAQRGTDSAPAADPSQTREEIVDGLATPSALPPSSTLENEAASEPPPRREQDAGRQDRLEDRVSTAESGAPAPGASSAQKPDESAADPREGQSELPKPTPAGERVRRERKASAEAMAPPVSEPEPRAGRRQVPIPDPTPDDENAAGATPPASTMAVSPPVLDRGELRILGDGDLEEERGAPAASTGGTAEPNDAPYGDMFFESAGVNPFIDTEDDRLSTFGLDVDTGSYTLARSYLERGHLPPAAAVRVEEFINFFSYGDEPPRRGDFALSAEGAPSPFAEGPRYQVVRFGVHGREIDRGERKPAVLTFVVDVSGSMGRENRLGLVRRSLELLLDQLYTDDRVGLVVYGDRGRVLLEPSADHQAIRRAIAELVPGGSTNAEEGLVLGYELARRHFREGANNRVILCSDGVANVGRTGPDSILERIGAAAEEGIELNAIGFGMGNYNDVLMERLADRGDGRYAYVDNLEEARRLFVYELTGTLETIAADAKVQVEFNPEAVSRYRLLGYENRDIADHRFRDDTVDAGEIGAGHEVSAVYEVKLAERARSGDRLARLNLRWRSAASGEVEEIGLDLRVRDLAGSWDDASPGLRLAAIVAELAEILRHSYWAREGDLSQLLLQAQKLSPAFAGDTEVAELVGLIAKAERLSPKR